MSHYPNPYNQPPQAQYNNAPQETDWRTYAEQVFRDNDFDGNGIQDMEEFQILVEKVFQRFGKPLPGYNEIQFLKESFDARGDGQINKDEYMEMMKAQLD